MAALTANMSGPSVPMPGAPAVSQTAPKVTLQSTGGEQIYYVPPYTNMLEVELFGAAGGGSYGEGVAGTGGCGGYAYGLVSVTPGMAITVQVGQGGGRRGSSTLVPRAYPAGGVAPYRSSYTTGQGGGRSAILGASVIFEPSPAGPAPTPRRRDSSFHSALRPACRHPPPSILSLKWMATICLSPEVAAGPAAREGRVTTQTVVPAGVTLAALSAATVDGTSRPVLHVRTAMRRRRAARTERSLMGTVACTFREGALS